MAGAALRAHPRFAGRNHSTGELGTCGARVTTTIRRERGPEGAAVARCVRTESKAAGSSRGQGSRESGLNVSTENPWDSDNERHTVRSGI